MELIYSDGGRKEAGFKGEARDCVCRAISIALERPYKEVYALINKRAGKAVARTGVQKTLYHNLLTKELGWEWIPTAFIGVGCTMHMNKSELPNIPRMIVRLSKHLAAVVNGQVHDTFDCTGGGRRCVYGLYVPKGTFDSDGCYVSKQDYVIFE